MKEEDEQGRMDHWWKETANEVRSRRVPRGRRTRKNNPRERGLPKKLEDEGSWGEMSEAYWITDKQLKSV